MRTQQRPNQLFRLRGHLLDAQSSLGATCHVDDAMKGRESGMPGEADWEAFFNAPEAIDRILDAGVIRGDAVEFGCGYGTFTIPAALRTTGIFTGLDIEPEMVRLASEKASRLGLANVRAKVRDFVSDGTGLTASSHAHAMIYNLLHIEDPLALLKDVARPLAS